MCVCVCFKIEVKFTQCAVHDLQACGSVVAVPVCVQSFSRFQANVMKNLLNWKFGLQDPVNLQVRKSL